MLASLPGEDLAVFAGPPPADVDAEVRPVYAFSETELPAVPTGRVFVQHEAEVDLAERVKGPGYEVESVPPWAPQAAWLVATDGSIATALQNLEALMTLDGIVSVEPQMLRPAARRGT